MSKKSLKILLLSFVLVSIFSLVVVLGVKADDEGTVDCTVTAQNISVTVSDGDVTFGTVTTSDTKDTTTGEKGVDESQTANNNGNITEDFNIKADDSTDWTLGSSAGSETYTMKFCVSDCDGSPTWNSVGIEPDYEQLADDVAKDGDQIFDLQVGTPTSTAIYTEQSITVTVQAVIGS